MRGLSVIAMIIGAMVLSLGLASPAEAQGKKRKAERLVRHATETLRYFHEEDDFVGLWDIVDDAKALIIVPDSFRGGFLFGGSGGNAVMVARNKDGSWSGPTFMAIGSLSFGLQAGGEISELVLVAMTNRGKERLLSSTVKLGADISIAAGPVGGGAKAKTADILAFSRSRGLYGGVSLEGSVLKVRNKWNRAYYDDDTITPTDIVFRGVRDNATSLPLREMAFALTQRDDDADSRIAIGQTNVAPNSIAANEEVFYPGAPNAAPTTRVEETPIYYEDDQVYQDGSSGAPLGGQRYDPYRDPR